jgi:hypothetical protein
MCMELMLELMSWYRITAAMKTATAVPTIESIKGPLERDLVVDRMISDTMLNTTIAASTPTVMIRALALLVKSK